MKQISIVILLNLMSYTGFSQSQNNELVDQIQKLLDNCSYFEVTEDMFNLISENEKFKQAEGIEYIKKIYYIIYVECEDDGVDYYGNFTKKADLKGFKTLMRSNSKEEEFQFLLKKKNGINEYLMLHSKGLSYVVTSLNIATLNEMSDIINFVGELGP